MIKVGARVPVTKPRPIINKCFYVSSHRRILRTYPRRRNGHHPRVWGLVGRRRRGDGRTFFIQFQFCARLSTLLFISSSRVCCYDRSLNTKWERPRKVGRDSAVTGTAPLITEWTNIQREDACPLPDYRGGQRGGGIIFVPGSAFGARERWSADHVIIYTTEPP